MDRTGESYVYSNPATGHVLAKADYSPYLREFHRFVDMAT